MATVKRNNALYNSIKALLEKAKKQIVRNVNITMVLTYYEMGRIIVECIILCMLTTHSDQADHSFR